MSLRGRATGLAWILCGLTVGIAAARLGLAIADPESSAPITDARVPGGGLGVAVFEAAALAALGVVGAVVASRRPRNPVGWLLCMIPISFGLFMLGRRVFWNLELANPGSISAELVAWLSGWIWIPSMFAALVFLPLLFPAGRPATPRWRPVGRVAVPACVAMSLGVALTPGRLEDLPSDNPLGVEGTFAPVVQVAAGLGFVLMVVCAAAAIASMVVRFRRSRGIERQQLKWVVAAAAFLPVTQVPSGDLGFGTLVFGLLVIAVAVAIAILRYRLYDIDVVINRTLVYGSLTAALAATYLGSVLILQLALGGLTEDSNLAIAGSTLAVAALVRPARSRIQELVDRRFYRRRYDARQTLESFSSRLRDEVDLTALDAELRGVVSETMQPAHVSLWLRGTGGTG